MSGPRSPRPTSLPKGISAAGLGARIGAYLLDAIVVIVVYAGIGLAAVFAGTTVLLVVSVLGGLIVLGWAVLLWWRLAVRGASPGMSVTKLELIGHRDGKPIGWGRAFLRALIFVGLSITGLGLVIMLIMLATHPLRQGWHDLAVEAVMIRARATSPRSAGAGAGAGDRGRSNQNMVGLPAHLTGAAPQSYASAGSYAPQSSQQPSQPSFPQPGQQPGQPPGAPMGQNPPPFGDPFNQPSAADQWAPPPPPDTQPMRVAYTPPPGATAGSPPRHPGSAGEPSPMDSGNEATHLVSKRGGMPHRTPDQGWVINLDDGRQITVGGLVLLGRDPSPRPGEQTADLVSVTDNSRTVSKTHIAVGVDNKGIFVMDRGSTNGSAIAMPTGKYEPCAPGELVRVREGQIISFGDHRMEIRRTY